MGWWGKFFGVCLGVVVVFIFYFFVMRTSNPVFRRGVGVVDGGVLGGCVSVCGVAAKAFFLLFLVGLGAGCVWYMFGGVSLVVCFRQLCGCVVGGVLGGLFLGGLLMLRPRWGWFLAPLYGVVEGLFLGGLSVLLDRQFPGVVVQALPLSFGVLFGMLLLYRLGFVHVGGRFGVLVGSCVLGVGCVYGLSWLLGVFGVVLPFVHGSGVLGIFFSCFVVGVAALSLLLDFDFIVRCEECGVPGYMEWYGAFGLVVGLVWLYVELLGLLVRLRRRGRG